MYEGLKPGFQPFCFMFRHFQFSAFVRRTFPSFETGGQHLGGVCPTITPGSADSSGGREVMFKLLRIWQLLCADPAATGISMIAGVSMEGCPASRNISGKKN